MGKQIAAAEAEVGLAAAILDYYADRAEDFLAPRELPDAPGAAVETVPLGMILGDRAVELSRTTSWPAWLGRS